ncbi:hypothetical protein [Streptomyces sp. NPDC002516]
MSVTGVWVVGALPDETLRDLPRAAVQGLSSASLSMPEDVSREPAWWERRAQESIDGPLRLLRHAASTGRAVAAQARWY